MDWVWQSETWLGGWMLPAGSALVALGLTTLAAAAYAHWRMRRGHEASDSGEAIDLQDEIVRAERPSSATSNPAGLEEEIERLERGLAELRQRVEAWSSETSPERVRGASPWGGATLRRTPVPTAERPESSPEVKALRAFVAENR